MGAPVFYLTSVLEKYWLNPSDAERKKEEKGRDREKESRGKVTKKDGERERKRERDKKRFYKRLREPDKTN